MSNFCGTIGKTTVQARAHRDGRGVTLTIHDASGYRLEKGDVEVDVREYHGGVTATMRRRTHA
jgi:hypothetical protein